MNPEEWDIILDLVMRGKDDGGAPANQEINDTVDKFKIFVEEEKDSI